MKLCSLISIVFLVGLLTFWGGVALAQELDPKWLGGTWKAATPSPAGGGREDQWEIVLEEGGTFKGDIQSARGGLINVSGSWKIEVGRVTLDGTYVSGPQVLRGTKFGLSLTRSGEALEGTRYAAWNNSTIPISFRKAK